MQVCLLWLSVCAQGGFRSLFSWLASFGAYRSAISFARLCAAIGHGCADHRLQGLSQLEYNGLNAFHISIKKFGTGAQHSVTATAADILAAPLDLTWTLPALFICTDLLLAASSAKKWAGTTRTDFIRNLADIPQTGWGVDAFMRRIKDTAPQSGVVVDGVDGGISSACGVKEVKEGTRLSLESLKYYFTLGQPVMFRNAVTEVLQTLATPACTRATHYTQHPHPTPTPNTQP